MSVQIFSCKCTAYTVNAAKLLLSCGHEYCNKTCVKEFSSEIQKKRGGGAGEGRYVE